MSLFNQQLLRELPGEHDASTTVDLPTLQFRYVDVIAEINVGVELDLSYVYFCLPHTEYRPDKSRALRLRIVREPQAVLSIFTSGKIVARGTKTPEAAYLVLQKGMRLLQSIGIDAIFLNFRVKNINASFEVGRSLPLHRIKDLHEHRIIYVSSLIPLVKLYMKDPRVHFAIFGNGFVYIQSAKCSQDIFDAMARLLSLLATIREGVTNKTTSSIESVVIDENSDEDCMKDEKVICPREPKVRLKKVMELSQKWKRAKCPLKSKRLRTT